MSGKVSTHSKEVAKGTFWGLAGNIAFKLFSFLYTVALARMATQEDIGLFYLALSVLSLLSLFVDFGLSQSFARYIPYFSARSEGKNIMRMLKASYSICIMLSAVLMAIIFWQADYIVELTEGIMAEDYDSAGLAEALRYLSPYLLVYVLFKLNTVFLQGQKRMRSMVAVSNLQNASKLILSLALFVIIGANIFTISIGYLLSFIVAVLFSFFLVYKGIKQLESMESRETHSYSRLMREILPFGLMMIAAMSLWTIIGYLDRLMIYLLEPSDAAAKVAIYTMATSLAGLIMMFPNAIGAIFFPVVSKLFGEKRTVEMRETCATSTRWLLFMTVPLAFVFVIFSRQVLNMFYGLDYVSGWLALSLFSVGLLIRSISMVPSYVLAGMRLVRIEIKVAAAAAVTNILLNILLIPFYGINGAAAASALSFFVATALFLHYSRANFGFTLDRGTRQIILAALISFIVILLIGPSVYSLIGELPQSGSDYLDKVMRLSVLAILFAVSVIIFAAISLLMKSFRQEDIGLMEGVLRRAKVPERIIGFLRSVMSRGIHE